jgi:hypothetical protein
MPYWREEQPRTKGAAKKRKTEKTEGKSKKRKMEKYLAYL